MIRREGRVDHPEVAEATHDHGPRHRAPVHRNWEGPAIVLVGIVVLMVGAIAGMNTIISQLPWAR
jgi:hypothetical protein